MKQTRLECLFFLVLFSLILTPRAANGADLPDSLLTEECLYEYTFTDFDKACTIIGQMRKQEKLPVYRLDIAEGDLYFNTGSYRRGLYFYRRAFESEAVRNDDAEYMDMLHRMISSYDCLHEENQQTRYTELLLEKARAGGNVPMESVALFNMGKMLCYQEDKERGYKLIREAIGLMENSDYKYKYDNLRYNYNTLLILLQRDGRCEEALEALDDLARVIDSSYPEDLPVIDGLYEKERKTLLAQRTVLYDLLNRSDDADRAYREWSDIGGAYTKDDYLVIPYLMNRGRYDEAIRLYEPRERFLIDRRDTINYHMMTLKRTLGQAYAALGNYKRAAGYFEELAVLTDSLKRREQQSAAMDLAIANEVHEKERLLQEKDTQIRIHNILLAATLAVVVLLVVLLWRGLYHMRIIRRKNRAMVGAVAELVGYKERLQHLGTGVGTLPSCGPTCPEPAESGGETPDSGEDEEVRNNRKMQRLFEQLDQKINSQQLFLNPDLSREDLMRLINTSKNQISQVIQFGTGMNLSGYLNGLRMDYAVRRLVQYPEYTINAVAQEAGIPNLSSFHRLFKAKFGMTPAEFRNARREHRPGNTGGDL